MATSYQRNDLSNGGGWRKVLAGLGRHEFGFLLTLVLLALGIWFFIELADEVNEGDTRNFDRKIMLALRDSVDQSNPLGPRWFEEFGRDITSLGGVGVLSLLTIMICGLLILQKKTHTAALIVAAALGALLFSSGLKRAIDRSRPDLVPHGQAVYNKSFPSGHAMLSAAVYLTLAALLARAYKGRLIKAYLLLWATLITVAIGVSRVYLGVHWPTDVLAGWAGGGVWALLCWTIAGYLQRRGKVEPPQETALENPAEVNNPP